MRHDDTKYVKFDLKKVARLEFPSEGPSLNDFFITHLLGQGAFGKVYRGELDGSDKLYAIKSIRKDRIAKKDAISSAFIEFQVLKETTHQFLVKLEYFY